MLTDMEVNSKWHKMHQEFTKRGTNTTLICYLAWQLIFFKKGQESLFIWVSKHDALLHEKILVKIKQNEV